MKITRKLDQEGIENMDLKALVNNIIEAYDNHEGDAEDFALAICCILESRFGTIEDFE